MASFGLSDGSWGSEAARPRRKRPYLPPSAMEEEEEEEGGWGGPWGDRNERERPRRPREAEAEGCPGRSRPRWDPPRGGSGRSRSPPSNSRRSGRARRSLERSGDSPGPPSSASAWTEEEGRRQQEQRPSLRQRTMEDTLSQTSRSSSGYRSKRLRGSEGRQDPEHWRTDTCLKNRGRSGERWRGPEPTEGGFPSCARGEGGWRSPSQGGDERGISWGSSKWKEDREDSPRYSFPSHFDSDLRGTTWDSPELRRKDYERLSTSGKGLEMCHSTSEDLEDWGSSTGYLEEWSLEEDRGERKNLQGGSGGPEGHPNIYVGSDKHAVAPRKWVPHKEVVDFWNQCQSVMHSNVKKYFLSTCPRPTLPDDSCRTPILNPNIKALLTSKQLEDYMASSHFLRLTHEEVLNMLGPVMTISEMAEESIEKQKEVDPLELREWARRIIRYIGSLNQRLKLLCCSHVLEMFDPTLKTLTAKLSGWSADGMLFAEEKVNILKDFIRSFPELENQTRDMKKRNNRDQRQDFKKFPSHAHGGAAELHERILAAGTQGEEEVSLELWHRRFGHQDEKAILDLQNRSLGVGIQINKADGRSAAPCAVCLRVKGPNPRALPRIERMSTQVLDLIHVDLHGPFPQPSLRRYRYALIFVDDFSRYCFTYLLMEESIIQEVLTKYITSLKKKFQRNPKALQIENGAVSLSQPCQAFLEEQGILYNRWGQPTLEESRTAVREMRSLLEMTECMLADAALSNVFWDDALMMAAYLLNILPAEGASETPFQLWHKKLPYMKHLRVFGSLAYCYMSWERKEIPDSSIEETILLGYGCGNKRYKVKSILTGKVLQREVHYFVEEKMANKNRNWI